MSIFNERLTRKTILFSQADEQKKKLESKLKAMESKLLSGGKNILDHTNEQHRELEQRRKLISEQNKKERMLQQDLEEKEEVGVFTPSSQTILFSQFVDFFAVATGQWAALLHAGHVSLAQSLGGIFL